MNRLSHPVLLSILACTVPLAAQGAEHDLRVTAKKGASLWYTQESKMEQSIDMGGQQMDMGNSTTYTLFTTVKDVDEKGLLVVETKVVRVKGTMTIPMMGDIEFDSADVKPGKEGEEAGDEGGEEMGMPDFDAIGRGMTALAGATFVAKVDAFGKVQSMEGVEKTLEAARKKAGSMGAQMLGASLNDNTMERLVASAFGSLPDKPVAVGGSWERNEDVKSARMPVANKMKLTLAKIDADSFEVTAAGTIEKAAAEPDAKADEGDEDAESREMLAKMKIANGKITGSTRVSRQDGFMIESTSVMSMDLTLPSPMGGDMSIAQKNTTVTKRTTEADAMPKKAEAPKDAAKDAPKDAGK